MQTGFGAIRDAINRQSGQRSGPSNPSPTALPYFGWRDDDKGHKTRIIRFLTDEPILCKFYEYVICKDGKTRDFIYGPSIDSELGDYVKKYGGKSKPQFGNGEAVEPSLREMTAGMAVLRKEVPDPDRPGRTKVIDYVEKRKIREPIEGRENEFREVELDTRWFGIVKQGNKNFWNNLLAYHNRYGTICDRDYEITRTRNDQNTTYSIIPVEQDPDLDTVEKVQAFYGYGQERDPKSPDRLLMCPITLKKWAYNMASEGRAKFFLGEENAHEESGLDEFKRETSHNPAPEAPKEEPKVEKVEADVSEAAGFSAMKAKLLGAAKE